MKNHIYKAHGGFLENILSVLFKTGVGNTGFIPHGDWVPSWKTENQKFKGLIENPKQPKGAKNFPLAEVKTIHGNF